MAAEDAEASYAYLDALESRLVLRIDWNRAAQAARELSAQAGSLGPAEFDVGHRGFLELGGARLIDHANEATAGSAWFSNNRRHA